MSFGLGIGVLASSYTPPIPVVPPSWLAGEQSSNIGSSQTNKVLTLPASRVSGNLMLAVIFTLETAATIPAPTGWTQLISSSLADLEPWLRRGLHVFTRVTDAAEGATVTFVGDSARWMGSIHTYDGVGSVMFPTSNGGASAPFSASMSKPEYDDVGITTLDDLLVPILFVGSTDSLIATDGYTAPADVTVRSTHRVFDAGYGGAVLVGDRVRVDPPTPGDWVAFSGNASHNFSSALIVVLKPVTS